MKSLVILGFISTLCVIKIHGFSSGKLPLSVCDDMKPGPPHGENQVSQKEDLDPPFSITATKEGDGFVLVDIATDLARFPNRGFKGLFLMAESHGQRGYGYFVPLLDSKAYLTPFNCENLPECEDKAECQGTANAIVHTNNEVKTNVSALWFAPSSMSGKEVTFVATVVERNDAKGSIWFEELESLSVFV